MKNKYTLKHYSLCFTLLLAAFFSEGSLRAQVSVVATQGSPGPASYVNLSSAFAAIDSGIHQGNITVEISSSFTDVAISTLNSSGSGSASYTSVLVRPVNDNIIVGYISTAGRGLMELNGSDNVTIDGDNPNTAGTNRNLTFTNAANNTTAYTSVIRIATGATAPFADAGNITIKNVNINGSATSRNVSGTTSTTGSENTTFGIVAGPNGGTTVTALSSVTTGMAAGATADNLVIQNCTINQCARGIAFIGGSASSSTGVTISDNVIGDQSVLAGSRPYTSPVTTVYTKGIIIMGVNAVNISNNTVKNILSYVATPLSAIELNANIGTGAISIANNNIEGVCQNGSTANGARGIYVLVSSGAYSVTGNTITNIQGDCPSSTQQPAGIQAAATTAPSGLIQNNKIRKVYNWNNSSWGVNGILISGGNNVTLQNNQVTDILQDMSYTGSFGASYSVFGLKISAGTGHKIYHNSIHLSGATLGTMGGSQSSFAFAITNTAVTGADVRNNIFSNVISGGTNNVAHASVFLPSGATSAMNLTLNNNAYFCGNNDTIHGVGQVGSTAGTGFYVPLKFASWTTAPATNFRAYTAQLSAAGNNDSASMAFNYAPAFISANDLHIIPGTVTGIESSGAITPLTTDMDGDARPGPAGSVNGGGILPDLGADEGDFTPVYMAFDSSIVEQVVTSVLSGTSNQPVLKVKVYVGGYVNQLVLTSLKLSTTGTSNLADIDQAKVYYTGANGTFSTANLFGSIAAPGATFTVTGNTPLKRGVNYLWLAYDVNLGAGVNNLLDGTLDSLELNGVNHAPVNGNPAGNIIITNPMTYISSEATQTYTSKVGQGSANNRIIGVQVVTSATGTPVDLTSLDFNTNGTTDTANIRNIKVWYTGSSPAFTAGTQFGTTIPQLPGTASFQVTGTQALANGTNYFWLTYDIDASSLIGNIVDAECLQVTVAGVPYVPSVTAPAGNREIRAEYCNGPYTYSCSNGDYVNNFYTTGAVNNVSFLSTGCNNTGNSYNFYQSQTIVAKKGSAITLHYQGSGVYNEGFKIWIDYNQDGVFDVAEQVASAPASLIVNHSTIIIPCGALTGLTRVRIRDVYAALPVSACSQQDYGETEDYEIEIIDNPVVYEASTAIQFSGSVAQGVTDRSVLRIPVKASGCGIITASAFYFNTAGSTNPAGDIVAARLYVTGNSPVFNTSKLLGTVSANGAFIFNVTDTLLNNDTTNYWLAYDVNAGATVNNVIDARFDSITVGSNNYVPVNGNPPGNFIIQLPMSYISSTTSGNTTKVASNTTGNQVLKLEVVMSASGSPVNLTQINLNANGTTDTANIRNIKVWYSGSVNDFSAAMQFGTTLNTLPGSYAFSATGVQPLTNGSNYFWLTYDVVAGAAVGNLVDAECTSLIVNGITQIPSVTAPAGARAIRNPYCIPTQAGTVLLSNVTLGTLNNTPSAPSAPYYREFAASGSTTCTVGMSQTYNLSVTTSAIATVSVWIDYNDDGTFSASEWTLVSASTTAGVPAVVPVTIPCGSFDGQVRMRIRSRTFGASNGATDACTAFAGGETQDYTITIVNTPVSYGFSTAIQRTGNVAPNTSDKPVLRIPVRVNGCSLGTLTSLHAGTTGSTSLSDILAVKLYSTGNSPVFSTAKQLGTTIYSPGAAISFSFTDTLVNNDTTNYWLTYDVSTSALYGNQLDAVLDSVEMNGVFYTPVISNPSGNLNIDGPMQYLNSSVSQSSTAKIGKGTSNNMVIGMVVNTSANGSPVNVTQLDFNVNGTTDTADIRNIKVWYTGSNNQFNTGTQVGTTLAALPGSTSFNIPAARTLTNGANYFWLTYDIAPSALSGNMVDAECVYVYIDGIPYAPTVTAPAGALEVRDDYCVPHYTSGCADGDYVNNFSTSGAVTNVSNLATGCNGNTDSYVYYASQVITVNKGAVFSINYRGSGNWPEGHKVWIDFNQNGIFDTTELVAGSAATTAATTATVIVPVNALEGFTRLRIRNVYNAQPGTACSQETWGETEDYTVNILPAPVPTVYTWNKTTPDSFNIAANWIPARTYANLNDILHFNNGVPVTVNNVQNNVAGQLVVTNNTFVTLNAPAPATFIVSDSLQLLSGGIIAATNLTISLGTDTIKTGVLTGTGTIQGIFKRWINSATTSYLFPLASGTNNRNVNIGYTTVPAAGGTLTARFYNGFAGNGGLPLTEGVLNVNKTATTGYWALTAADGLTGGTYDIAITAAGFSGITSYSDLVLLKRAASALPWTLQGIHQFTIGSNASPVLSRVGLTGFSEFGVGGDSSVNPLPVKQISFTAAKYANDVLLKWNTSSEVNNKGFFVERSHNNKDWNSIGFVDGKGTVNKISNYLFTDAGAFANNNTIWYYRLKQVDINAGSHYSHVVSVSAGQNNKNTLDCYPNPFSGVLSLDVYSVRSAVVTAEIIDISGKLIWAQQLYAEQGDNKFEVNGLHGLKPGIYMVRMVLGDETIYKKLSKAE
jgi:hypothetical protein